MTPDSDLSVVHRAGRIAAVQASLALAAVLLVVGAVVYFVDIRVQEQQIRSQLSSVALAADDVTDPPPGMILVLRDLAGKVAASADGIPTAELLARPAGFSEAQIDGAPYRALVDGQARGQSGRATRPRAATRRGGAVCCYRWASRNWPGSWPPLPWSLCSPEGRSAPLPRRWPCNDDSSPTHRTNFAPR